MDYFTGGPPRQLVAHGQSKPQGPQPASESPTAARTAITAKRRTIRNPFPSPFIQETRGNREQAPLSSRTARGL